MESAEEGERTECTVCMAGVGFYEWECSEAGVVGLPPTTTVISMHGLSMVGLEDIFLSCYCAYLP